MKILLFISIVIISGMSFAECESISHDSNGESKNEPKTIFGGCTYISPTLRIEYSGYFGIGGILPLNQSSNWEGGFSENGISLVASIYEDGEIYDIGYTDRNGWAIFTTGWDIGLSYRDAEEHMRGVYFGYSLIGAFTLRYLKGDFDEQISLDVGLKF